MFKNYLKITLRNLVKHRVHSTINVLGLSVGIAVSLLMLLFAWNTLTYDQFHKNADDIYFLYRLRPSPEGTLTVYDTWVPTVPEMQKDFPEIIRGYRSFSMGQWVHHGEKRFREEVDYAEPEFFQMFSFPLLKGDRETALAEKSAIVISQEMAEKYFGSEEALGKTLQVGDSALFTVTGVLDKIPPNSSFRYDFIVPWDNAMDIPFVRGTGWRGSFLFSYVQLRPGTDPQALEAKFPAFVDKFFDENAPEKVILKLMLLAKTNNEFTQINQYAYILIAIALMILALACINYTNLSTARSLQRAREIGMRKVLGANRLRLIRQFLSESLLIVAIALGLGVALAELLLPEFNRLIDTQLELSFLDNLELLGGLILVGLTTGFFAGIYPALFLSRFRPVTVLKAGAAGAKGANRSLLRKSLVVAQFVISISLIIATGVVLRQINFMKGHDLKFDRDNLLVLTTNTRLFNSQEEGVSAFNTLREELLASSAVQSAAFSSAVPGRGYSNGFTLARPEGWEQAQQLDWRFIMGNAQYFSTYNIPFTEGRNFSAEMPTDQSEAIIINEAARKVIGWESALGKSLYFGERSRQIIGVVTDFHYEALREPIQPVIHFHRGEENPRYRFLTIKFANDNLPENIALVQDKWNNVIPQFDISYFWISDRFRELYQVEEGLAKIISYSAILAIFIACLGLFGLSAFSTIQRTREIGIRKVLGASTRQVLALVGKDFLKLVLLANLVAWPLGYFILDSWLQEYPYRISLSFSALDIFFSAALITLMVAIVTVSYQTLKAAFTNPVEALRYE